MLNTTDNFISKECFIKLIHFYVIHTPCKNISNKSIPLINYGWNEPWKGKNSLKVLLKKASDPENLLFSVEKKSELNDVINQSEINTLLASNSPKNIICFINSKGNQFISIFFHIRNAFAHGRFEVFKTDKGEFLLLEDWCRGACTAKMLLLTDTLLK